MNEALIGSPELQRIQAQVIMLTDNLRNYETLCTEAPEIDPVTMDEIAYTQSETSVAGV